MTCSIIGYYLTSCILFSGEWYLAIRQNENQLNVYVDGSLHHVVYKGKVIEI